MKKTSSPASKLTLNKKVIVSLSQKEMISIHAGDAPRTTMPPGSLADTCSGIKTIKTGCN